MTFEHWYTRYKSEEQLLREQHASLMQYFTKEYGAERAERILLNAVIEYPEGRPTIVCKGPWPAVG